MIAKKVMPLIEQVWRRFQPTEQINALAALTAAWARFGDVRVLRENLVALMERSVQNEEEPDGISPAGLADRDGTGGVP